MVVMYCCIHLLLQGTSKLLLSFISQPSQEAGMSQGFTLHYWGGNVCRVSYSKHTVQSMTQLLRWFCCEKSPAPLRSKELSFYFTLLGWELLQVLLPASTPHRARLNFSSPAHSRSQRSEFLL